MPDVDAVFFDVGGILLTNGWDRRARARAVGRFDLEPDEFESRHELVVSDFERGHVSLHDYMRRTVFHRERPFSADEFRAFMLAQSRPYPAALALAGALSRMPGRPLLATLNNESRELNEHRIRTFELDRVFDVFLSSCYLGVTKPGESIFQLALELTQHQAERCVFIDDRPLNVECARLVGFQVIQYQDPASLRAALARLGFELPPADVAAAPPPPPAPPPGPPPPRPPTAGA